MHAARIALIAAALVATPSCTKNSPPPQPPAEPAAPATEPATPAEPELSEEEKQKAAMVEALAKRLADDEAAAQERKERWTPELEAAVTALTSKKFSSAKNALTAITKSPHRAPGNAERDAARHPIKTLTFFGIKPTMRVFEIGQGAGWYTELLAPLLAKDGKLFLAGYDANSDDPRTQYSAKATALFLSSHGNLYEKVETVQQGAAGSPPNYGENLDMVIVARMLHNIHRADMWDSMMPAIHAALTDKGVLAIVQHRAAADANPDESAPKGYLPEAWLIEKIEGYGFKLAAKSEINANPKDTKDYEQGVWTLPPVLREGDKDKDKYLEIGESDRSTLKFVKVAK